VDVMYGIRIKELRKEKQLTQGELAELLSFKSASAVGMIEREEREINIDTLNELSKIFEVSIDYILGNTDKQTDEVSKLEEELPGLLERIKRLDKEKKLNLMKIIEQFEKEK